MKDTRRAFLKTTGLLAGAGLHAAFRADPWAAGEETGMRTMRYGSMPKEDAVLWQRELRAKLFDLLKMSDLIAEDTRIPLELETHSSREEDGYLFHELEMNSTPGRRMEFVATTPTHGEGPWPAVIILAGHGGSRHTVYGERGGYYHVGRLLAAAGYVTVSATISQHTVYKPGRTNMGERLWDLMRCVDYLLARGDVDPERIGSGGKSLGGEMVMWLGAMDDRVKANLVSGFLTTMDQMERNHCMCWKLPGLRELVDFADIYSLIAPRPLLFQNGLDEPDSQFPPALALEVLKEVAVSYRDFEAPENVSLVAFKGGHVVHVPSALSFFHQHLRDNPEMVPFAERTRL